ncbi:acyl-CoA dehydrogenase family protein [Sporichthya polymorpha]|uniref:acyl-CoA dehydrogenase family protein n=1 Tax=Sporichthya polymorpha TaxID=35751 RepID=UPI00035D2151|nr:acyl-CoA dehydrogenase family protein [Sporichthya polymorpha]
MDLTLSQESQDLLARCREWAVTEGRPFAREADRAHANPEATEKVLSTCPLDVSPLVGEDLGRKEHILHDGRGSNVLACGVMEQFVYGDAYMMAIIPGTGIGGRVVRLLGTPEQVERWFAPLAAGVYKYTGFALTEPGMGSDTAAVATTATRDGDNYILNGAKIFCSGGAIADFVVVFATIDKTLGGKGIRAFVVDAGTPGFSVVKPNERKLGMRNMQTSELNFDNCVVPAANLLGDPADPTALRTALHTLGTTRPQATSVSVGVGQAQLDETRERLAAERASFAPHRWRAITEELDRMDAALQEARLVIRRAAWRMDQGLDYNADSSMAKAYAGPIGERVILRCLQLMGSSGYSEDDLFEKRYRDAKILDIWEGTGNIQRLVVSRSLLTAGPAAL